MRVIREVAEAAVTSWTGYARGALRRDRAPWGPLADAAVFWQVVLHRSPPRFHHDSVTEKLWTQACLRNFSTAAAAGPGSILPTLVVPPRSGQTSCVVDLSPRQSLLGTCLEAGLDDLHCIEWLDPTAAEDDWGIEEHLRVLDEAVTALGGRVNLVGFSQGGWLAATHAARRPESVATLTVASAPIDCERGVDAQRTAWMRAGRSRVGAGVVGGLPWDLLQSGRTQAAALNLAEWPTEWGRMMALWGAIDDPAAVEAETAFRNWINHPQDVPTALYRWTLEHLFLRNELARGEMTVGGERIDLAAVECPLFLLAGTRDTVTPPTQLWALADLVSTPRESVTRITADTGHLGMVCETEVLRRQWLPLLRDVAVVSARRG
ncbi:alpha/beta fold hydrolase [Rhodococcus tukisamuensis]|uniref:Uncharacterized protein n=1 Tax=Rhodococcus tukisamuensis TaxID=168276 RepID=A0A1G6XDD5_9NOCA|nr:alpha/beta fold hydrolase [Rhodococcus tukisamuensis]SDD76170.1 Protein of unknown function [Rhodococcus tukisamuensis]